MLVFYCAFQISLKAVLIFLLILLACFKGELTRQRRDTEAINQDGGAGDRYVRVRHDTQADQPVRNIFEALQNIDAGRAAERLGWNREDGDDVPGAGEDVELEDNR